MNTNINEACRAACASLGVEYHQFPSDDTFHPVDVIDGRKSNKAGRIKLFSDQKGGLVFNFKTGERLPFFLDSGTIASITPQERQRIEIEQRKRQAAKQQGYDCAAIKAMQIWQSASLAPSDHPYLAAKQIKPYLARLAAWERSIVDESGKRRALVIENCLLIPLLNAAGQIRSLQAIFPDKHPLLTRNKDFLPGGQLAGLFWWIGGKSETVLICEGFATGCTLHDETGHRVYLAFTANNLLAIAKIVREKLPDAHIIIAADNDTETAGNPGLSKATAAAQAVDGSVIVPQIPNADFNDYAAYLQAVSNEQ